MASNDLNTLKDSWLRLYPGGAFVRRSVVAMMMTSFLVVAVLVITGIIGAKTTGAVFGVQPGTETGNVLALIGVAAMILSLAMGVVLVEIHGRLTFKSTRRWAFVIGRDPALLRRLAVSPEINENERKGIISVLNEQWPQWRLQAGQTPADMVVPRLPQDWTQLRDAWTGAELKSVLILLAGAAAIAGAWWAWHNPWVAAAGGVLVLALASRMDQLGIRNRGLMENHILAQTREDDLILLEAAGQLTADADIQQESVMARQLLMRQRPGWSLSPSRPTWEALCSARCAN